MAEVLVQFDAVVTASDGRRFIPRACGRPAGNVWDGWIEFVPIDVGPPVRTPRETEQPNRADLLYWAQGLTQVYLDGALTRALLEPVVVERERAVEPYFEGPAPPPVRPATVPTGVARPVLDPFSVALQGADILLRELGALDTPRIRDIALAYGFSTAEQARMATREHLTTAVIAGVRRVPSAVAPEQEPRPGS
ncbi:MAG TPA: hypothetical protein VFS57_10980 [Gemmatimonadaceae bacterium]|nr:hypothetical protein [Gemmatimonadaceae bacterium]